MVGAEPKKVNPSSRVGNPGAQLKIGGRNKKKKR